MTETGTTTQPTCRPIPLGSGACKTCDEVHPLTDRHDQPAVENRYGITHKRFLLPIHGPRGNRCLGGRMEPKPWLDASGLPSWDDMTDLDRGAALMFVWKAVREGYGYARDNYPARYVDHPTLRALDVAEACRHARTVAGTWAEAHTRLGADEVQRLYDLALNHDRSNA
ncbi:hypothetical protein ACGFIW_01190 [Micromonospora sp. NPDC048935]|uniref:hypothetical protein n=1 Tax=Micromonospora sp. NPDC048935 TaxID=3364262 RepID=UPI0037187DEC